MAICIEIWLHWSWTFNTTQLSFWYLNSLVFSLSVICTHKCMWFSTIFQLYRVGEHFRQILYTYVPHDMSKQIRWWTLNDKPRIVPIKVTWIANIFCHSRYSNACRSYWFRNIIIQFAAGITWVRSILVWHINSLFEVHYVLSTTGVHLKSGEYMLTNIMTSHIVLQVSTWWNVLV